MDPLEEVCGITSTISNAIIGNEGKDKEGVVNMKEEDGT